MALSRYRRIRSIKPEILEDTKACRLSDRAWRLFVSIWTLCDDQGRFLASTDLLLGQIFPAQRSLTCEDLEAALAELTASSSSSSPMVQVWDHEGERYGHVVNWSKHQRVDKAKASTLPPPPGVATIRDTSRQSGDTSRHVPKNSALDPGSRISGSLDPGSPDRERENPDARARALSLVPDVLVPDVLPDGSTDPLAVEPPRQQAAQPLGVVDTPARREAAAFVDWFSKRVRPGFSVNQQNQTLVGALLAAGHTQGELRMVARHAKEKWATDEKMRHQLVPSAVLKPERFAERLDAARAEHPEWAAEAKALDLRRAGGDT